MGFLRLKVREWLGLTTMHTQLDRMHNDVRSAVEEIASWSEKLADINGQMENLNSLTEAEFKLLHQQFDEVKRFQAKQIEELIQLSRQQVGIQESLLKPFQSDGTPNKSSALDERLYQREDVEWDEVVANPFAGLID